MSRRCKPGQRARVIGVKANAGKIVLVVGHYLDGSTWGGCTWSTDFFPWKVVSIGAPLNTFSAKTKEPTGTNMYCVFDDSDLEPLDDDDDGLTRTTEKDKPVKKPRPAKVKKPMGTTP